MQPLEPGLSFIAQKYLNHSELRLTRFISHYRRLSTLEVNSTVKFYYETMANNLKTFQDEVPLIQRAVLQLIHGAGNTLRFESTYRQTDDVPSGVLATVQLDREPRMDLSEVTPLGQVHILNYIRDNYPDLSLTCILRPIQGLADDLLKAGWVTTTYVDAQDSHVLVLSDGKYCVYITINIADFAADTAAIKEYHANKGKGND